MQFGEKYGDIVRVVDINGWSMEVLVVAHVKNTKDIEQKLYDYFSRTWFDLIDLKVDVLQKESWGVQNKILEEMISQHIKRLKLN